MHQFFVFVLNTVQTFVFLESTVQTFLSVLSTVLCVRSCTYQSFAFVLSTVQTFALDVLYTRPLPCTFQTFVFRYCTRQAFALALYWAIQAGLLTPGNFARHRLSPLAAFTSGAYISSQWKALTVNLRILHCQL